MKAYIRANAKGRLIKKGIRTPRLRGVGRAAGFGLKVLGPVVAFLDMPTLDAAELPFEIHETALSIETVHFLRDEVFYQVRLFDDTLWRVDDEYHLFKREESVIVVARPINEDGTYPLAPDESAKIIGIEGWRNPLNNLEVE